MIELSKAIELLLSSVESYDILETELLPLEKSLGRVLAEPMVAQIAIPPFSKALMDGYALGTPRKEDISKDKQTISYVVVGTIGAGDRVAKKLNPGEAVAIMTGAMVPEGTERVVPIEECTFPEGAERATAATATKTTVFVPYLEDTAAHETPHPTHILHKGAVMQEGDTPLTQTTITPKEIGLLGSLGYGSVPVRKHPKIAIITTGSELIQPGNPLPVGAIYDSNGHQLLAQAQSLLPGAEIQLYQSVADSQEGITQQIAAALESCDMLILNGGVSMGAFDYVPGALESCGVEKIFHRVAIKPGKPIWFGKRKPMTGMEGAQGGNTQKSRAKRSQYVFGLPGNPISALVGFHYLVTPVIRKLQNLDPITKPLLLPLGATVQRRDTRRAEFIPLTIDKGKAYPIASYGSADLSILSQLEGFLLMEIGISTIREGSMVDVRPI